MHYAFTCFDDPSVILDSATELDRVAAETGCTLNGAIMTASSSGNIMLARTMVSAMKIPMSAIRAEI